MRTSRILLRLSEEESIVMCRQQTLFGFRLIAGYVDMPWFDTSYAELNICCGTKDSDYMKMICSILFIISKNPIGNPFKGIPAQSKIKPYFNDPEFCATINSLINAQSTEP